MSKLKNILYCFYMAASVLVCAGCSKSDGPDPDSGLTTEEKLLMEANKFVYTYTKEAYLWSSTINSGITYTSAPTPQELFELMRYKELDLWSYVSDNSQEVMDGFAGVSTTYGYSLAFGKFTNTNNLFAVVQFVYPDSPALQAGLERGDIILTVNGSNLTESNYMNLYYSASMEIGFGEFTSAGAIAPTDKKCTLAAVKMYEDPVVYHSVIEAGNVKAGYLLYTGFYAESHNRLAQVFEEFKDAGVSELILDLRYNPGGNAETPVYLASMIAPENVVKNREVFLKEEWNQLYMNYFKSRNEDMNTYFKHDIPVNLNLGRVFVLTSAGTASASEATISGLSPYMDVVKIGEATHGKYCGAALLSPTDSNGKPISSISNWLLSLVVYKFVNANGFTEFKDGIAPNYEVPDSGLLAAIPLGSENDPMVAKAISIISGSGVKSNAVSVPSLKGATLDSSFGILPHKGGFYKLGLELPDLNN